MNDKIENLRPRWKPGQSGNLKGRPRGSRNRVTLVALSGILPTLRAM